MNIGIDRGYYAIKTRHFSFPAGIAVYSHEPYSTHWSTVGSFFVWDGPAADPTQQNGK